MLFGLKEMDVIHGIEEYLEGFLIIKELAGTLVTPRNHVCFFHQYME